ncbi:hypothetical protein [Actinomycetospora soli]|uniref:hypothetical protein n=1 Tax=Actinomycetospora soli TaxID=2893887 RepID=UPI001E40B019|nr:hypothetical protein [Actinomycetospora soli]MCD2186614.1 hypothetical protein [Actinomycetospora soli]
MPTRIGTASGPLMNLRELVGADRPYWQINREERNLVALLYAALLQGDNLIRFLRAIDANLPVEPEVVTAYVEYAYLRDIWAAIGRDNSLKRKAITELLRTPDVLALQSATTSEWNEHFGVRSRTDIESPSNWVVKRFDETIESNADFIATCRFKWCFRAKPDLVIHTTHQHALVIEAKVESGEGSYPATAAEKSIFKRRGLRRVSQTELQEHMMRELLGIEARHVFLTLRGQRQQLSWSDAFKALDLSGLPTWAQRWVERY